MTADREDADPKGLRDTTARREAALERAALTSALLASFLTPFTGSAITVAVPATARRETQEVATV